MKSIAITGLPLLSLLGLGSIAACQGTETDNPVSDNSTYVSPDRSSPLPSAAPGCEGEFGPGDGKPSPFISAQTYASVVRGEIHQALTLVEGMDVVAATEPPALSQSTFPDPGQLDAQEHLILVDTANPDKPTRVQQLDLEGDFWFMLRKGERLWVATARRIGQHRGCDGRLNPCYGAHYETLIVTEFAVLQAELTAVSSRELPMSVRAQFDENGAVGVDADRISYARFLEDGSLEAPRSLPLTENSYATFPVQLTPDQLRFVVAEEDTDARRLHTVNATVDAPGKGTIAELGNLEGGAGPSSMIYAGHLWLEALGAGSAQLWRLDTDPIQQVPIDSQIRRIVPLAGVQLSEPGQPAIAVYNNPTGGEARVELVVVQGNTVTSVESWSERGVLAWPGNSTPVPPSLQTLGTHIFFEAAGLPLRLVEAPEPAPTPTSRVTAFIELNDALTEATLLETYATEGVQPNPTLKLSRGDSEWTLPTAPSAGSLLPVEQGVLVISREPLSQCEQSERDCSDYAPGISLVNTGSAPSEAATLDFPDLELPAVSNLSRVGVNWGSAEESTQLQLSDGRWVFIAEVDLTCQTDADCLAMGIEAIPIAEAGVAMGATQVACPPTVESCESVPAPPAPTVYGSSHRQYFYALTVHDDSRLSWERVGSSVLESSSGLPSRNSRFAEARVSGQTLFATRLERLSTDGQELPKGVSRVMLDRFVVADTTSLALPPVNLPGRPITQLSTTAASDPQSWLSVEALPGEEGLNTLHVLEVGTSGAQVTSSLPLEASLGGQNLFYGFAQIDLELQSSPVSEHSQQVGVILASANSCSPSRLQLFRPSSESAPLELTAELELPSDRWELLHVDANRALVQRERTFALIEISETGELALASLQSTEAYPVKPRLTGNTLRAAGNRSGSIRLDF